VIVFPNDETQWNALAAFMQQRAGVDPSQGTKYLGWVDMEEKKLAVGVAFNGFMGNLCQIHVAMAENYSYTPKEMLREVFQFAFDGMKRELLIGVVSSLNKKAMKFDKHLGFVEHSRFKKALYNKTADLIILTMTPEQCKYYEPHKIDDVELVTEEAA